MDVKYLNYILAIANRHNMTKAAEDLFVSQSSLSQYLSRLEQELGTPLFVRSKGELSLTPAGVLYVEAAKKVVKIQKELYQNIAALNHKGRIRVGVTSNWGLRMLAEIIPLFREQYPGIIIEITETNLPSFKKFLAEGTLDVGLAADVSTVPFGSLVQILREEEVFLAVSMFHPYALAHPSGSPITAEEVKANFANDSLLLSKKGSSLRMLGEQFFESCGFEPVAVCETNNISATRSMVAQNAGIAFISESCSVNRNNIAYYPLSPAMKRLNLVVRQKDWVLNEPEQAFMDLILNYFKNNTEQPYLAEKYSISL
ncbi:LysR family transcriptional regulator [Clostridium sp. OM02-18AC]|uniref:LysR family transcriptional regulator n=1 Tax=Clostridium sp. OM02-18AC TaxID=2292311 RepID=UPI000E4776DB|nr:LysR family transcriptional regulator [Clostridium sp. OM02-18AC]RHV65386.1 LysR family transcriptional regulator [Clostridium sp. OM02-18AC]